VGVSQMAARLVMFGFEEYTRIEHVMSYLG
jgi:hypothetical protein